MIFPLAVVLVDKIAHTFRKCPNKNAPIPTLQLTLKKPCSKKSQADPLSPPPMEQAGWNLIGKGNKTINPSKISIPYNNIYLTERGGINVIYESDDSDESLQHLLNNEEMTMGDPNLIAVAADLHPYNIIMHGTNEDNATKFGGNPNMEKDSNLQIAKDLSLSDICVPAENNNNGKNVGSVDASQLQGTKEIPANFSKKIIGTGEPSPKALESTSQEYEVLPTMLTDVVQNENTQLLPLEEEMQEYDEEPYDYEYDDLVVDELGAHNDPNNFEKGQPIMFSDDPPFSEKDLDEFINNDLMTTNEELDLSEGTFHSMQKSINSSSSFINGMERLIVHLPDQSKSTSSKRKASEGTEDTATSEARKGKKLKV